jgi:hypothetical protein
MFKFWGTLLVSCCVLSLSSAAESLPSRKFETWYPAYGHHFEKSSDFVCNHTLSEYIESLPSRRKADINLFIAHHADCVLANSTETIKANMASAGIILGLMPYLLSYLGPSISESGIVMLRRPFLAVLLVIGGPSIYPARVSEHYDSFEALKPVSWSHTAISPAWRTRAIIAVVEFSIAGIAAANTVIICLELGFKTIITWKKRQTYLPIMWVFLSLFVHLCGTFYLYVAKTRVRTIKVCF